MATKPEPGVRDWQLKRAVIRRLLGAWTHREIAEAVLGAGEQQRYVVSRLESKMHKFASNTPISELAFLNLLVRKLNCSPSATGTSFIVTSVDEFIELLPPEVRPHARSAANLQVPKNIELTPLPPSEMAFPRVMHLHDTEEAYSMAAGIKRGVLDTRHYYSAEDSAETWERLVLAEAYPTYDQCKLGLRALMGHQSWKNALDAACPTTAVMLGGGGSPTKDLVLARSLLDNTAAKALRVTMILVDVSPHMLIQSQAFLLRAQRELPGHDRIDFQIRRKDILSLGTPPSIMHRTGPAVFAITGGTIGNLSEHTFFRSLNQVAQSGDLLIVSADTVDDIPPEKLKVQLTRKYKHADMQRMIAPGVIAVLKELHIPEPIDSALERVTVDVAANSDTKLSDVPDSWNVTLNLAAAGRNITLVRSTRYSGDALVKFAGQFGWESLCSVPSPLNPHFVQFSFRRK